MGQKIRAMRIEAEEAFLIFRNDTRRVELVADLSVLEEQEISYELLKTVNVASLEKSPVMIGEMGLLHAARERESLDENNFDLPEEDDQERLSLILKKSSIGHVIAIGLLLLISVVINHFKKEAQPEPQLVTIVMPEKTPPPEKTRVQVSHTKIQKHIPKNVRVTNRTVVRPKTRHTAVHRHTPVHSHAAPVISRRSDRSLERVGALAALGGLKNGARNAEGLDAQSMKNIRSAGRGLGGGGVGATGRGGISGMMNGSGLIAGSAGSGGRAQSAGGYGTKGVGGGRAGYGKIAVVGGSAGLSLPTDEAEVQGGLDMNQIAAVINKNKGQIIYCYEKGLQTAPDLRGRVAMQFVIGGNGRITSLRVAQSSLDSDMVENCMAQKMRGWKFPQPVGKVEVDVFYPFDLRRVSAL
jgi:outer membrane biosynthesis protein TonB